MLPLLLLWVHLCPLNYLLKSQEFGNKGFKDTMNLSTLQWSGITVTTWFFKEKPETQGGSVMGIILWDVKRGGSFFLLEF